MALFFEEQMSSTGTVACATCHAFSSGGVDPRAANSVNPGPDQQFGTADDIHGSPGIAYIVPPGFGPNPLFGHPQHGFGPQVTPRRTPTVINTGYHTNLGYDGSKPSLEDLIHAPPVNSIEMGRGGRTWNDVAAKIAASNPLVLASNLPQRLANFINGRDYPAMFQVAFGSAGVTPTRIKQAIAAYLRTLNSDQTRFDMHLQGLVQLTLLEQQGLTLFTSVANGATSCNTCHGDFEQSVMTQGPIAGQMTMTSTGPYGSLTPTRLLFHNVGVRPFAEDPGRQNHTGNPADGGKFRVASLRNVELTAPYFHTGSMQTLDDVIDFYDRGGDFHTNQAANLTQRNYTTGEKSALVAILQTLTDPRVSAGVQPFDAPTLGSQNGNLVTSIGSGLPTASGTMTAHAPFAPVVGQQEFAITLEGVSPGTFTFLAWDTATTTTPLPANVQLGLTVNLQFFGIGPASWLMSMPHTGTVIAPMPLPNDPGLSGVTLFGQWLALEPSGQWPVSTSNVLRVELQ